MDYKKSKAPVNTITRDVVELWAETDNIYESVAIIAKRANQISVEIKQDLSKKLAEFASYSDSLEDVKGAEPLASSNPQDRMIQADRVGLIKQIVDSLPEKQRSCMQLRDFEGKSYKEIAMILDITEEQVKVNIFRARQAVKHKYMKIDNYGL